MAEYETIQVERSGRVGIIRLNRPEVMNAFNGQMYAEWGQAAEAFNADPAIGAIVSTGNGRAYSSGADIAGFESTFTGGQAQMALDAEMELGRKDGVGQLTRRRQQIVIDWEYTRRGWRIINITPRDYFQPL